jgi:ribosome-binding factor A
MRHSPSEPSQRQLRVGEQIRHIVSETMQRGHFHHKILQDAGRVTVTEVRVSPDMKNATAYVMSLGGEQMDKILPALNDSAGIFQKEIGRQIVMKFTPRIIFKRDDSFEKAQRIDDLLRGLNLDQPPRD